MRRRTVGRKRGEILKKCQEKRTILLVLSLLLCFGAFGKTQTAAPVFAYSAERRSLVPVGKAVGIKLFSDGVMVVGLAEGGDGGLSPAAEAGLTEGDRILAINGEEIQSTEHVQELLREFEGTALTLSVFREDQDLELTLCPEQSENGCRMGAWIRDSMAGIGTMTYYDPQSGAFGALGHSINDVDTGLLMPLADGAVMRAEVTAVRRGAASEPGELKGDFDLTEDLGTLYDNNECGVFGTMPVENFIAGEALPVARSFEIQEGGAQILADVSGEGTKAYDVEITKIYPFSGNTRNMLVTVTDKRLLSITGGIVQGMSGSPILQNGRIVGAVTHVLLDDPAKGYGIFIENMLEAAES